MEGVSQFTFYQNTLCDIKQSQHICSLDAKGDEGNSHHQQVQEVEVIPTERSFMEEGSVCGHLRGGGADREFTGGTDKHTHKKNTFCPTHTHAHAHTRAHTPTHISHSTFESTLSLNTLK